MAKGCHREKEGVYASPGIAPEDARESRTTMATGAKLKRVMSKWLLTTRLRAPNPSPPPRHAAVAQPD